MEAEAKTDALAVQEGSILLAVKPDELAGAHQQMRRWAGAMEHQMKAQAAELKAAVENAKKHKWATATLERHHRMATQRRAFYRKIIRGLDAGYLVIPNFQMDPWVVRTDRKKPSGQEKRNTWSGSRWFPQKAQKLPAGEGRYVAHAALAETWEETEERDGKEDRTIHCSRPTEFDGAPEFPFEFASPYVMDKVAAATEERVFDEIGVAEAGAGDPILLGRLLNPKAYAPNLSFFLAWALDLRRL